MVEHKFIVSSILSMLQPSEKPVVIPDRQPIIPEEIRSQAPESKMDAKLCPCDSNLVAFIHRNDLWVHNLLTGEERRLTYTNGGSPNMVDEPVSAGVPSFVVQEEFDRYTGYWWQPKCEIDEGGKLQKLPDNNNNNNDICSNYNINIFKNILLSLISIAASNLISGYRDNIHAEQ